MPNNSMERTALRAPAVRATLAEMTSPGSGHALEKMEGTCNLTARQIAHVSIIRFLCARSGLAQPDFRIARPEDADRLQAIRRAAFAPIFDWFRSILSDEVIDLAQRRVDESQGKLLELLLAPGSGWEVYVVQGAGETIGFVTVRLDHETSIGESGLNAVDPAHANSGIGTAMYEFALVRMREAGMKVATVATGADPSHDPARRAYRKAGFNLAIPSVWLCQRL